MPVQSIYEKALDLLEKGEDLVLCVIVATAGSTPRGPGSKMLVGRDGIPMGTVGGGQVEYKAVQMAGTLMGSRGYRLVEHELVQDGTGRSDGVCGGRVRLLFLPMDPGDLALCSALRQIADMERTREKGWVSFELKEGDWKLHAWASGSRPAEPPGLFGRAPVFLPGEVVLYAEPIRRPLRAILCGGGHVGQALCRVLVGLDYAVTVYDDREYLALPDNYPGAERVILGTYGELTQKLSIEEGDYVLVMTHGHRDDFLVLCQVLRTRASYIGCLGSERKAASARAWLGEEGFSEEDIRRIHCPVGLPIGAKTPGEIAISIAAQMIQHAEKEGNTL